MALQMAWLPILVSGSRERTVNQAVFRLQFLKRDLGGSLETRRASSARRASAGKIRRRKPGSRKPLTTHHSARTTGNRRTGWRGSRERGLERRLRAGEDRKLAGMPARLHRVADIGIDVVASRSSSAHTSSSARGEMITGGSRQKLVRQLPRFTLGKTKYQSRLGHRKVS